MTRNDVWRDVLGYEGAYQVSDLGRVRSLDREIVCSDGRTKALRGRVLKPGVGTNGYLSVALGRGQMCLVHRLVAQAFIDNPDARPQVNHRNGRRDDNQIANLEWATCSENHKHAYAELPRKLHARTMPVCLLKDVVCVCFDSLLEAATWLGVSVGAVGSAIHNNHQCKGYEVAA